MGAAADKHYKEYKLHNKLSIFGVLFLFYIHCGYQILAKQLSAVHGCALSTINSGCFRMHASWLIGPNYTICGLDYKEKVNVQTMGAVGEPKNKIR